MTALGRSQSRPITGSQSLLCRRNGTVDVRLDRGYPAVLLARTRFVSSSTLRELDGVEFPWGAEVSWLVPPMPSTEQVMDADAKAGKEVIKALE